MNGELKKRILIYGSIVVIAVLLVVFTVFSPSKERKINNLLELGNKYLEELDYDAAIAVFDEVLSIEPKNVQAYSGKASAYAAQGNYEEALSVLEEGINLTNDNLLIQLFNEFTNAFTNFQGAAYDDNVTNSLQQEILAEPIILNYVQIVRTTDTANPEIQLEVINSDKDASEFEWSSSAPDVAQISEKGLITCQSNEGYCTISVSDNGSFSYCNVIIASPDSVESESTTITVPTQVNGSDEGQIQYLNVKVWEKAESAHPDSSVTNQTMNYIYYSGDVYIPEKFMYGDKEYLVSTINSDTFAYSNRMTRVQVPSSVTKIENEAEQQINPFRFCDSLEEIAVDDNNDFFTSKDGVLFSKDMTTLVAYPAAKAGDTYTIPSGVTNIYSCAFAGCTNLKSIEVEDGNAGYESRDGVLYTIETASLTAYPAGRTDGEFKVPEDVEMIGGEAFYNCDHLEQIQCAASVKSIGYQAFHNCDKLEYIGGMDNIDYIGNSLFTGSSNVKRISGGEGTITVDLRSDDYSEDKKVLDVSEFGDMVHLQQLNISNYKIEGIDALEGLNELKNISMYNLDVSDISWLKGMEQLESLNLVNCDISDISPLSAASSLARLDISGTNVTDLSPIMNLENLSSLTVSDNLEEQGNEWKEKHPEGSLHVNDDGWN